MRHFTLVSYKMITVNYNRFDKQTEVFFPLLYTPSKQMNLFDYLCEYFFSIENKHVKMKNFC